MAKKRTKEGFGVLRPKYHFCLNPYPDFRCTSCPDCGSKTGQRKEPLLIHVDPKGLIALNYTNRYCGQCDRLIAHKHEIEHHLTDLFRSMDPERIGNEYLIIGTVEKKAWRENIHDPKPPSEFLAHVSDFKSYEELRMTMAGWFPKGQTPPVVEPPEPTEWVKR